MVNVHKALQAGKAEIDAAIRDAERGNSGEVVVVSTRKAGNYAATASMLALIVGAIVLIGGMEFTVANSQPWESVPSRGVVIGFGTVLFSMGYLLGYLIASFFPGLCVALTRKRFVAYEVERSAALAFRKFNVARTKSATGVLIFLAEAERRVVVMGDAAIAREVTDAEWESIRDTIIQGIAKGQPVQGVKEALAKTGGLLRIHFGSEGDVEDELPSEIHLS